MIVARNFGGWNFRLSNQATPTLTSGTSLTPGNNTFSSYVEIISDTNLTEDCYGIFIRISDNSVATAARDALVTLGVDPAGGTSYVDFIPNLIGSNASAGSATVGASGIDYYFPVLIKAGTAIAAKASVNNATVGTLRVTARVFGAPRYSDHLPKFGFGVDSFGEVTASSRGTTVTPGNSAAEGAYTQLGSNTAKDYCWWQLGVGINDPSITNQTYYADLGIGDGTTKMIVIENEVVLCGTNETMSMPLSNAFGYYHDTPSGVGVYGRASASATADTGVSMAAYGVWC